MKIYLYENRLSSEKLFPICSNRPIFDLKCGVYSIFERVKNILLSFKKFYQAIHFSNYFAISSLR